MNPSKPSRSRLIAFGAVLAIGATACGEDGPTASPAVSATLTAPTDGQRVYGGVDLMMTATGVTIAPAGQPTAGTGHFHVIADAGCLAEGDAIGKDADHVHFGTGSSTGTIFLDPGRHSLCLQVGDGVHTALGATDTVEIEVAIDDRDEWCDVVAQTDSLLASLDGTETDFAAARIHAENLRRLTAQLADGLDAVDADARADVSVLVDAARTMFEIMIAAESEEAAAEQIWGENSVLPTEGELDPAIRWVSETCGVGFG